MMGGNPFRINLIEKVAFFVKHNTLFGFVALLFGFSFFFPLQSFALEKGKQSLPDIIRADKLDLLRTENKIERSDLVVSTLIKMAEEAELSGDKQKAILYAEEASRFSPESPLPHFFLSHLYGITNAEEVSRALNEYLFALRLSLNHFWLLSSSVGIIGVAAFFAVILSVLTFFSYASVCYAPQWIHCAKERFSGRVHKYSVGVLLVFLLSLLFFLLPPFWFFLVIPFLFWFFYQPVEKRVAFALSVGLLFLSLIITPCLIFLTAKRSSLLDQIVKNQQAEFLWSTPFSEGNPPDKSDWKVSFIQAAYKAQERDLEKAEIFYQEVLSKNPNFAPSLNNLGNIYFYRDDLQKALEYYEKTIQVSPNYIPAHYNISQVKNEMLAFGEGEKKYDETKRMDPELVKTYSELAAKYPNYPMIEGRFTKGDIWKELFALNGEFGQGKTDTVWRIWVGDLSSIQFIIVYLIVGIGLVALYRYLYPYVPAGGVCSICFKAICDRCQQTFSSYKICGECGQDMKIAVGKKMGGISKSLYPFYALPGGGYLALKKPWLAMAFLIPFYFLATLLAVGDRFFSSAHWHLSIEKSPLLILAILILYGLSAFDLFLRRNR